MVTQFKQEKASQGLTVCKKNHKITLQKLVNPQKKKKHFKQGKILSFHKKGISNMVKIGHIPKEILNKTNWSIHKRDLSQGTSSQSLK